MRAQFKTLAAFNSSYYLKFRGILFDDAVTEWFVTRLAAPTESDTVFVERIFVTCGVKQFRFALHDIRTV
jgi:hypothetical protein